MKIFYDLKIKNEKKGLLHSLLKFDALLWDYMDA